MHEPDDHEMPTRRMRGTHLLVHLRWAGPIDRVARQNGAPHRPRAAVVLIPGAVLRRAMARLAPR